MKEILEKIDELLAIFYKKGLEEEYLFEDKRAIVVLNFTKFELLKDKKITDLTHHAFICVSGCSYQNYLRVNNDIHNRIVEIDRNLYNFIEDPFKREIETPGCHDIENWIVYLQNIQKSI